MNPFFFFFGSNKVGVGEVDKNLNFKKNDNRKQERFLLLCKALNISVWKKIIRRKKYVLAEILDIYKY